MKQIAGALVKAQRAFEPARKTSDNPHFRSKYADLATCVEAVLPALNDNGITLIQSSHECGDGVIIETIFLHESGELLSAGKLHVPASKNDPQGYGSALTYARWYSLLAACGIAPEDDDGHAATPKKAEPEPVKRGNANCITEKQANMLKAKMRANSVTWADFAAKYQIEKLSELHMDFVNEAIEWIESGAPL